MLPQVDGVGHAHAYIAPEIEVMMDGDKVIGVTFVDNDNRADLVGGFCVFPEPEVQNDQFQVVTVLCPLQGAANLEDGAYRVIVDFTENSHGPRIKSHPRDVPPGASVSIELVNKP